MSKHLSFYTFPWYSLDDFLHTVMQACPRDHGTLRSINWSRQCRMGLVGWIGSLGRVIDTRGRFFRSRIGRLFLNIKSWKMGFTVSSV